MEFQFTWISWFSNSTKYNIQSKIYNFYFIDFAMYENTNFGAHESKQFPETTKIESTNISTFTINVYFYENESALSTNK